MMEKKLVGCVPAYHLGKHQILHELNVLLMYHFKFYFCLATDDKHICLLCTPPPQTSVVLVDSSSLTAT